MTFVKNLSGKTAIYNKGAGVFFDRCGLHIYFSFEMATEAILRGHCQYVSKPVRDVEV